MPLYKFYRIVPKDMEQTDCYIGHTTQPLRKRFTQHATTKKKTSSSLLFERYGRDGLEIVLIHELELTTLEEARREERRLYEDHRANAINQVRPFITKDERKEQITINSKAWKERNRSHVIELRDIRYEKNKEKYNAVARQWAKDNKERHRENVRRFKAVQSALKYFARITIE